MDTRKPIERMNSYLRGIRPLVDFQDFDRTVRLTLNWFDSHRIREPKVFVELEGKEYAAFKTFIDTEIGYEGPYLTKDFVVSMMKFAAETR
jgi:hypothetical protein